jgi:hypothetical protein
MSDGLFVQGQCAYCGLTTIDFCPECQVYVCRRCDTPRHWPDVGIAVDVGFAPVYSGLGRRFKTK